MAITKLGQEVRRRREAKGLSRKRLSLLAGLGETYISELERGDIEHPRVSSVRAIARALGDSISDLTGEPELAPADGEIDFPRLLLAVMAAAKSALEDPIPERDLIGLIEASADLYDWLAKEEREGRTYQSVDQLLQRIILVKPRRRP